MLAWEGTHLFSFPVVSDKVDISSLFIHSLGEKTTSLHGVWNQPA